MSSQQSWNGMPEKTNVICIIPARGGSKRIPGKNRRLFLGKPIIQYSIEAALSSGCFEEVMVSTDSPEIAELSIRLGANVPFMRSKKNADDYSTTSEVIYEVLVEYEKLGIYPKYICCLYPTAPFVTGLKLKKGYEVLITTGAKSVITVTSFSFPIQRSLSINNGRLSFTYPEYISTRSQDLEKKYHDCGQFYFIQVTNFLKDKQIFTDFSIPLEVPETEVQDIDNETDWKIAELKFEHNLSRITQP